MSADPKASYYDEGGIETIDIIRAKLTPEQYRGYCLGTMLAYVCRANFKGSFIRDMEKIGIYTKLIQSPGVVKVVYVSGPYSTGNEIDNVELAIKAGERLAERGLIPIIPHLNHFWAQVYPHGYDFWMWLDKALLLRCDALYRMPGKSPGADEEVEFARARGIPVYEDMADVPSLH